MKLYRLSLFITMIAITSISIAADIHQWVDEHGNTHFSDNPPSNVDSTRIEIKQPVAPTPGVEEKTSQQSLREQEYQRQIDEVIKQKLAEKEAEKANKLVKVEKCKEARERLAVLQQNIPIYVDEQGKFRAHWAQDTYQGHRKYISDAQRPNAVDKANQSVSMNCKNPYNEDEQNQVYNDWYDAQYCASAQVELAKHEKSSSRSSYETIEKKREQVEKYCK